MAAGIYEPIRLWNIEDIRNGTTPTALETASFTPVLGEPCTVTLATGRLAICGTAFQQVACILYGNGSNGTADTPIAVAWVDPVKIWEVTLNEAWAENLRGRTAGLVKDGTTKAWYLSTSDAGNQMTIIGPIPGGSAPAVGDTKFRVLARFRKEACQVYNAPTNGLIPGLGAVLTQSSNIIAITNEVHHIATGLIKTITTPAGIRDGQVIQFIPDAAFTTDTTGNISLATTAVTSRVMTLVWDAGASKWNPSYVS